MPGNVFIENSRELTLADYLQYAEEGRGNLGDTVPLQVYRLLEYSLREELQQRFGKDVQADIFRSAGFRAGSFFAQKELDMSLSSNQFLAQLQTKVEELDIGVLRIEQIDPDSGKIILTVSEDADCSGLPLLGETVCNYDEGFLSGILSCYTGKHYSAVEVDCWATGSRVCRFQLTTKSN